MELTEQKMKIINLIVIVLITGCGVTPQQPTPRQEIKCNLTCDNPIYIKPGNQRIPNRKIPNLRESVALQIQSAFNLLQPDEQSHQASNPNEALRILNNISTDGLNISERTFIWKTKAFCYVKLKKYQQAIDEFTLIISSSPQISAAEELSTLKFLWQLHNMTNNYSKSAEYVKRWALILDDIEAKDYYEIATIFEGLNDYPAAIANLQRGMELNEIRFGKSLVDYQKLKRLYLLNKDSTKAQQLDEIIITISRQLQQLGSE
jgi:tetratricopeptide (TPR) repeat protein